MGAEGIDLYVSLSYFSFISRSSSDGVAPKGISHSYFIFITVRSKILVCIFLCPYETYLLIYYLYAHRTCEIFLYWRDQIIIYLSPSQIY